MSLRNSLNVRSFVAAMSLGMALAASSVSAGPINWGTPATLFEDDSLEFLWQANGETDGIIREGDIFVSINELNAANGVAIGPQELTGVAVTEVLGFANLDGVGGDNDVIFGPASVGFNAVTGLNVVDGGAGEGAMWSIWLDPSEDLTIDAGSVLVGTESCQDIATCIAQASNGNDWLTVGFSIDPDNFWVALNMQTDTNVIQSGNLISAFASVNAGLSILDNQTGQNLLFDSIPCGIYCGAGNGMVDFVSAGSIKGGDNGGQNGGEWFGTNDFDMVLLRNEPTGVPAPATIALFGIGLAGLGWSRRKKS